MTPRPFDKMPKPHDRESLSIRLGMHPSAVKLLSGNKHFFWDLIQNSKTLFVMKDREGRYLLVNRRWEGVTGLKGASVLGNTDTMLFRPARPASFVKMTSMLFRMASNDEVNGNVSARDDSTGFVRLSVSDDGCGMDKETLDNIFEPFFTTKDVAQGTGLGLATVYGIVQQNNGIIRVQSEPGRGATFNIYLPRLVGTAEALTSDDASESPSGDGEMVLLVEDDQTIREMCRLMLEELGYRVLCAEMPEAALRIADDHRGEIDLLLTNVVMPGMNGRALAHQTEERSIRRSEPCTCQAIPPM